MTTTQAKSVQVGSIRITRRTLRSAAVSPDLWDQIEDDLWLGQCVDPRTAARLAAEIGARRRGTTRWGVASSDGCRINDEGDVTATYWELSHCRGIAGGWESRQFVERACITRQDLTDLTVLMREVLAERGTTETP